jgi:DNA polymerase-3 subunit gamma/tau
MLSTAAFNALLKTLEEPPEHVKFIFATTDVQKVLPTILSRCQRFDLRRIPGELIARHLDYIAGKENIHLEAAAAATIARGAEGGLRDAESMLDQLVAFCGETITEADVLSVFGFTASQTVSALCEHLLDGNSPAALSVVHQQAEAGRDLSRLMADLIGHLRNLLVAKADPNGMAAIEVEVGKSELAALQNQAARIAMDRLLDLIEQFAAAEGRMKWAPNKKLHFEIAVIKAIQTLSQATLTEVLNTLAALRTGGELPTLRPVQPGAAASALPASSAPAKPSPAPKAPKPVQAPPPQVAPVTKVVPVVQEAPAAVPVEPPIGESTPAPVIQPEERMVPEIVECDEPPVSQPAPSLFVLDPIVAPVEPPPVAKEETPPWEEPQHQPALDEAALPPPQEWRHPQEVLPEPAAPEEETPLTREGPQEEPAFQEEAVQQAESPKPAEGDIWSRLLAEVSQKKPLLRVWVEAGTLLGVQNGACLVGFPEDQAFAMASLSKPSTRRMLEETLFALTGKPLSLKLEQRAGLKRTATGSSDKPQQPPPDPMEEFKNDPIIRRALDLFKAEIDL